MLELSEDNRSIVEVHPLCLEREKEEGVRLSESICDIPRPLNDETDQSFAAINTAIMGPSVLGHLDYDIPVMVCVDANKLGVGGALLNVAPDGNESLGLQLSRIPPQPHSLEMVELDVVENSVEVSDLFHLFSSASVGHLGARAKLRALTKLKYSWKDRLKKARDPLDPFVLHRATTFWLGGN